MRLRRLVLLAAAPLALAALLGTAPSASAGLETGNSLTSNGLATNGLSGTGPTTGAGLDDLDGVAVEAATLPGTVR